MASKFSIRYKFLAVTTFLLLVCVGTYLLLASHIFKEDKKSLVFDYNRSLVVNLSNDFNQFFKSLSDKIQLVAYFNEKKDKRFQSLLNDLLEQNQDLVWVGLSYDFKNLQSEIFSRADYKKTYGLEDDFFVNVLQKEKPIPFEGLRREGEVVWSATLAEDSPALIGFAQNVVEEDEKGVPVRQFAIVAYIKIDRILASLKESRPNENYLVSAAGEVLVHPSREVLQSQKLEDIELFNLAKNSQAKTQVLKYSSDNQKRFGAFAKSSIGHWYVLSSVSEDSAFKAVNDLMTRSLLFGSILVTLAFILAIFFSQSLTRPIEVLVGGMKKVSDGDLETSIKVNSRDEIASLAQHFNQMIKELKKSRLELEEINRELENKVKERTLQLEERNHAVKEAQEALLRSTRLAAVGEVAGLAAHEVLNPLTSIISRLNEVKNRLSQDQASEIHFLNQLTSAWKKDYSSGGFQKLLEEWQKSSAHDPQQKIWDEDLSNIEKISSSVRSEYEHLVKDATFLLEESQRINRIIQSFRGLSSVKSDIKKQSIHQLCQRSVQIMADLASKHKIQIVMDLNSKEDMALIDEDEFIQVMTNVIRNSIQSVSEAHKDTHLGEIRIQSQPTQDQDGRDLLAIHVRDNGGGLDVESAKKLFIQKFTTKSRSEGTGIGLSLSRRLMRAFKGDLKLSWNQPGQGAQFTIEIPIEASKDERAIA